MTCFNFGNISHPYNYREDVIEEVTKSGKLNKAVTHSRYTPLMPYIHAYLEKNLEKPFRKVTAYGNATYTETYSSYDPADLTVKSAILVFYKNTDGETEFRSFNGYSIHEFIGLVTEFDYSYYLTPSKYENPQLAAKNQRKQAKRERRKMKLESQNT